MRESQTMGKTLRTARPLKRMLDDGAATEKLRQRKNKTEADKEQ
jgi:hypothetical protein